MFSSRMDKLLRVHSSHEQNVKNEQIATESIREVSLCSKSLQISEFIFARILKMISLVLHQSLHNAKQKYC